MVNFDNFLGQRSFQVKKRPPKWLRNSQKFSKRNWLDFFKNVIDSNVPEDRDEIEIKTLLMFKEYNFTLCYKYKNIDININSREL